jgi:hypothetical protein
MTGVTSAKTRERRFRPSLIDRFKHWIGEMATPAWIPFLVLGVGLVAVQLLFLWLEGGLQETELLPVVIFNGLFTPYLLALIRFLDNQAVSALRSMRPALDANESELDVYDYRLSTMPFPLPLVIGLAMVAVVVLMERLTTAPVRYAALGQFRAFGVVFQIVDKSSAFLFGVFITHTIRQLRLVSRIHAHHLRVNLFDRRPLQAFSTLTAPTAVGLLLGVYGWMAINPDLLVDPVIFGVIAVMTVLAVVVFAWPLYGVHRRIAAAKERVLREVDRRSQAVFAVFNERIDADDHAAVERWNAIITSLDIQHSRISAIPTWPWRPESVRFLLAAIGLPLILEILLFFVGRALGW